MVASFLFIAAFTPALTVLTHQAVQNTNQQAEQRIDRSISVIESSKTAFDSSEQMLVNLENIQHHLDQGETNQALVESRELEDNYQRFIQATYNLEQELNDTEENSTVAQNLEVLNKAQDDMEKQIVYTSSSVRTGSTISSTAIDNFRGDFQRVASASATINAEVVDSEIRQLSELHESLGELSTNIMMMGSLVILISVILAVVASIKLSKPIRELSDEAEKIKNEELEEVDLSRIHTNADELKEFREVLGDMVLALKAEFERERPEMNSLALKVVERLSKDVPQATAESSVTSACGALEIDPMELEEENLDRLADELEISMKGLDVNEEAFKDIRDMS